MAQTLIFLTIGLPWLGALAAWLTRNEQERTQHTLAVGFSVAAGFAALALIPCAGSGVALRLPIGGLFGDMTFVADGLGVFLAAVATVIGSLAVIFSVYYMHGDPQLGRYYTMVLLFIGAHGRAGADQQHALPVLLLGDHGPLLLCPHLLLQRRSQGGRRPASRP